MSGRVLIIDDVVLRASSTGAGERAARGALTSALRRQGFLVATCENRADLVGALGRVGPQVVIVDPQDRPYQELVRLVRRHSRASILLLGGRGLSSTHAVGADDCLRRPFAMVDLIARVRALARRANPPRPTKIEVDGLALWGEAARVVYCGRDIELTKTERRVLALLGARARQVVSKRDLLARIWGSETGDPNVVEVNVSTLRRKLECHGPRVIYTIRGQGYRLGYAEPTRRTPEAQN